MKGFGSHANFDQAWQPPVSGAHAPIHGGGKLGSGGAMIQEFTVRASAIVTTRHGRNREHEPAKTHPTPCAALPADENAEALFNPTLKYPLTSLADALDLAIDRLVFLVHRNIAADPRTGDRGSGRDAGARRIGRPETVGAGR